MRSIQAKPERQQVAIGKWDLLMITDKDGHLSVHINHKDGSQVIATGADIDNGNEWGERFTTESIEREYANDQDRSNADD